MYYTYDQRIKETIKCLSPPTLTGGIEAVATISSVESLLIDMITDSDKVIKVVNLVDIAYKNNIVGIR